MGTDDSELKTSSQSQPWQGLLGNNCTFNGRVRASGVVVSLILRASAGGEEDVT